jgi:VIT1/CCC1 family predicted Fe2+/Mn2+ transporter
MNHPFKIGFCFGLTSGIITTLGLMVGLHSGTHSSLAVIGGVLTIAIADAFSDALGIHMSQEYEDHRTTKEIWESTLATFLSKFFFALTFLVPIFLFPNSLGTAITVSAIWGLLALGILSFVIAKYKKEKPWKAILEHLTIALIVIIITHYAGDLISLTFNYAKV